MRTVIAALVALAAVAAAVWVGLDLLAPRIEDPAATADPDREAQLALADFADAWGADDLAGLRSAVHPDDQPGLTEFLEASEQMRSALGATSVSLDVAEVAPGTRRRTADATVTVTLAATPTPGPATAAPTPAASTGPTPTPTPGPAATQGPPVVVQWPTTATVVERQAGWFVVPDRTLLHPGLRRDTTFVRKITDPVRASLLDINGVPLTSHDDLVTMGIVPGQLGDTAMLPGVWGEVLPNSQPQLAELLAREDLVADWYYPVVSISQEDAARVWPRLRQQPGVTRRDFDGTTTGSTFGAHVLGRVGLPTAEQISEWGVAEGEPTGVTGLERAVNDRLEGSSRTSIEIVDDDADPVVVVREFQSDDSGPVATSLDADVQRAIESALLGVEDPAAIAVVRTDGGIAGAASRPVAGFNRAFEGQYAPGDALAPVTAVALADAGTSMTDPVDCPARAVVAGATVTAPRQLRGTDVASALASGCRTSAAVLVRDTEPDLVRTATALGFEQPWTVPLPATVATFVEPIDTTEAVRAGVGQARVLATPLLMATIAAESIADVDIDPWLLQEDATEPGPAQVDLQPARDVLVAGLRGTGSAVGLLPASTSAPGPADVVSATAPPSPRASGPTTSATGPTATASPAAPEDTGPTLLGAVAGTGMSTGSAVEHAWVIATIGDLGVAVLVEDTGGDMALARALIQRLDRELADLRG